MFWICLWWGGSGGRGGSNGGGHEWTRVKNCPASRSMDGDEQMMDGEEEGMVVMSMLCYIFIYNFLSSQHNNKNMTNQGQ